jgi:hypothetical protein
MRINWIYVIPAQAGTSVFNDQMRFRTFFFILKLMKKNSGMTIIWSEVNIRNAK